MKILVLALVSVFVISTSAWAAAAVGAQYFLLGKWRDASRDVQTAYVAGVIDAVNYFAKGGSGRDFAGIAQCLNRFDNLRAARNWVESQVSRYAANITMPSVIAVNACR